MGKPTGFLEIERRDRSYDKPDIRRRSWNEFVKPLPEPETRQQAARCMDCGIPFCHDSCPVNNLIPSWNDLVFRKQWRAALTTLHSTNNFPEFTGRICPAPCEASCTLNIDDNPVTIKTIECAIVDRGWQEGWIEPLPPARLTGKAVAVVGSGPAGLACAQQLARAGHMVTVFEKADRIGGLLRYGIPDFKMDKALIDRRVAQMTAEGVSFRTNVQVGVDVAMDLLLDEFDAVAMTGGAEAPRDLEVPGRELDGIHFAMEYLPQQNKRNAGDSEERAAPHGTISAEGKHVVVIGGGDTVMGCVRTAVRQGAASVRCLYRRDRQNMPGSEREVRHAEEEGVEFVWLAAPEALVGENAVRLVRAHRMHLGVADASGRQAPQPLPGSHFDLPADLVITALGFDPEDLPRLFAAPELAVSRWGTLKIDPRRMTTPLDGVFAAGDIVRGASLVVWAIRDGRDAAEQMHRYLQAKAAAEPAAVAAAE
jgi:glutamate synthase (NADPH) small chain